MHQISNIKIENFKSIVDCDFPLSPYTPLVGYNNAGKTNVLHALNWLIKKRVLPIADFNNPENPVTITAIITGITSEVLDALGDSHKKKIEPIVVDGSISIRRTQPTPESSTKDIRFEVQKLNESEELTWELNPAGIDAAISNLFPEPIFIGAMENATEDVGKNATGTTIGKLIKEIIEPVAATHSGTVTNALAEIASKLSADSSEKDATLVDLDGKIQTELTKIFPGVSAKIHIPTPEFSDFLKGATIKIFEDINYNHHGRDASSFGHGAQRSIQIALIKCLSQIRREQAANNHRTTLLLIDEPELYLHPQAIELVRASLSTLSVDGYQVIFSTHSANMIARQDAQNALLIRRNAASGTMAYPRISEAVKGAIENADHQAETLFTLTNSSKILFSERIVVAEGKTERALLPDIFKQTHDVTIDEDKLGLVDLGGSGNIPNAMTVLKAMGIPSKAIVDLDFAFKVAPAACLIDAENSAIVACKEILKRLSDAGHLSLDPSGLPAKKGSSVSAAKAYELLCAEQDAAAEIEKIHQLLLTKNIWCWTKGTIESHLGLISKSPKEHMKFIDQLSDNKFRQSLPDFEAAEAMMHWLRTT